MVQAFPDIFVPVSTKPTGPRDDIKIKLNNQCIRKCLKTIQISTIAIQMNLKLFTVTAEGSTANPYTPNMNTTTASSGYSSLSNFNMKNESASESSLFSMNTSQHSASEANRSSLLNKSDDYSRAGERPQFAPSGNSSSYNLADSFLDISNISANSTQGLGGPFQGMRLKNHDYSHRGSFH